MNGMNAPSTGFGRPMSIKEISAKANDYVWNPEIGMKYWLRAADHLYRESQVYVHEGTYDFAYMLLLRFSTLVLENFPNHPDYKNPECKHQRAAITNRTSAAIQQLEQIRPHIERAYKEYQRMLASQKETRSTPSSAFEDDAAKDAVQPWGQGRRMTLLDASQHAELAVELAKKEIYRRRRRASIPEEEEQMRRTGGVWDDWDSEPLSSEVIDAYLDEDQDLRRQMEATRNTLDERESFDTSRPGSRREHRDRHSCRSSVVSDDRPSTRGSTPTSYAYPSISESQPLDYQPERREQQGSLPARPPKLTSERPLHPDYVRAPPRPEKRLLPPPYVKSDTNSYSEERNIEDEKRPPRPPKMLDRPSKEMISWKPVATLENGKPLRSVFLPEQLRHTFLKIAADHTRRGIELCGILGGTLVKNAFFISHLIIPEQRGTPDTCETVNEEALMEFCVTKEIMIVGWIHTHPTQSCFMSSCDVHTHSGYQVMMAESIAIVCAPTHKPDFGIFRLTDPPGLPHILACKEPTMFHQHSIDDIYTTAGGSSGHVITSDALEFQVKDLRPAKDGR